MRNGSVQSRKTGKNTLLIERGNSIYDPYRNQNMLNFLTFLEENHASYSGEARVCLFFSPRTIFKRKLPIQALT